MNYILFNNDGSIKKTNFTDIVNQNNDGINKIFVSVDGLDISDHDLKGVFILPDGTFTEEIGEPSNSEEYEPGHSASGYVLTLTINETRLSGLVFLTLQIVEKDTQKALYSYRVAITVNETVSLATVTLINLAQYEALLDYVRTNFATTQWVEDQHYLTNATYDYANNLSDLRQALLDGKKFIVLGQNFEATIDERISVPEGTIIVGNGGTFTRKVGYEGPIFWVNDGCEICNIKIDGNRSEMVSPTWDQTIEIALFGNDYIHDIEIIDANEAIVAYGDSNRIVHCKLTNCGGNGIHFSGGKCTVVDGCVVIGANKRSGMGHEDGCIVWSDECRFINCVNNYVEDGKTGFGAIDTYDNSYVKIVNNTIKDCINSFDLVTSRDQAVDVLIQGNLIINSGTMEMNKTSRSLTAQARYMIANNMLVKSNIEIANLDTISILGNMILEGTVTVVRCANVKVENNSIKNYSIRTGTLECGSCANVSIIGNYVRGDYYVINCYDSKSIIVSNNKIRAYSTDSTKYAVHTTVAINGANNEIASFNNGVEIGDNCSFVNNTVYVEDDENNSIFEYGGATHSLIAFNKANGVITTREDATNENIANIEHDADALFLSVTKNLTNITTTGLSAVFVGDDYYAVLTPAAGYKLPDSLTISMGGDQEVGPNEFLYNKTTGELIVFGVLNNLTITAAGDLDLG